MNKSKNNGKTPFKKIMKEEKKVANQNKKISQQNKFILRKQKNMQRNYQGYNPTIGYNQLDMFEKNIRPQTRNLINLIASPIHHPYPARFTDGKADFSIPLADYFTAPDGISLQGDWLNPLDSNAFLFYISYGPPGPLPVYTGSPTGWRTSIIPIGNNGRPQYISQPSVDEIFSVSGENYATIMTLSDNVRMIAMGMQVNSLIELDTNDNAEAASSFYRGKMRFGDFNSWTNPTSGQDIMSIIQSRPFEVGGNKDGASGRYNPFQATLQREFFTQDDLEVTTTTDNYNIDQIYFPYILVVFKQQIEFSETSLTGDVIETMVNGDCKKKRTQRYCGKVINVSKNSVNVEQTETKGEEQEDINLKLKYNKEKQKYEITDKDKVKNLKEIVNGSFTLPLRIVFKYWLEGKLLCPTPIQSPEAICDMFFERIGWYMITKKIPETSTGHSFRDVIKVVKKINPKNVRRAGKYAGGMISATRGAIGDITTALM